jgi:flagellar protein FliO/FliZ
VTPVGSYILQTVLTLLGVTALAAVILLVARRMGVGQASGPMDLVGRLPLDGRRAIYLVRVGERVFVVGASEAGLSKLGEVPGDTLPATRDSRAPAGSFAAALAQVLGRSPETGGRGGIEGGSGGA